MLINSSNKTIIRRLALADLKNHKMKTALTSIIIFLATFIMAFVFTFFLNDALNRANSSPYHVMYQAANQEVESNLKSNKDFEKVGLYKYFGGSTLNSGGLTVCAYMDNNVLEFTGSKILSGKVPSNKNEVLISLQYLKETKQNKKIGDTIEISYTDTLNKKTIIGEFVISGFLENEATDKAKQYYIIFSNDYRLSMIDKYKNSKTSQFTDQNPYTVDVITRLNKCYDNKTAKEKEQILKEIGKKAGVQDYNITLNYDFIEGVKLEESQMILIVCFILILMFVSSFAIYSIFYVTTVNSVQTFAQLVSIGTTRKQLKQLIKFQGNSLSFCCIPLGMISALIAGCVLTSGKWFVYDIIIAFVSGILIKVIVAFSLRKPIKILKNISPIEAMKYIEGIDVNTHKRLKYITPQSLARNGLKINRKKNRMSIISLSISGTLIIAMALFIGSIDSKKMLQQTYPLKENFIVEVSLDNFYKRLPDIAKSNPLTHDLINEIEKTPGVKKVVSSRSMIATIQTPNILDLDGEPLQETLNSISPELIASVDEIVDGKLKYDELDTDDIVINQYRIERNDIKMDFKVGDQISFEVNTGDGIVRKTFNVCAIAYFQDNGLFYILPDTFGDLSSYNWITSLSVFNSSSNIVNLQKSLQELVNKTVNLNLKSYDDDYKMLTNWMKAILSGIYGICFFFVFFGLLNMLNIVISSIIVRQHEFALLRAVGMTRKQLHIMLYREGLGISLKSTVISSIFGVIVGYGFSYFGREVMSLKFIAFELSIWPILVLAVLLIGTQMLISYCVCMKTTKKSLTEQLREN